MVSGVSFARFRAGRMSVRVCLPIAIILAAVAGCTPSNRQKVYPVSGAIFLNGEPAVGARVFFSPAEDPANPRALRPFAIVENDGSFRLTTYTKYDGAPAGDYVVIVTWSIKSAGNSGNDDGAVSPDRLKNVYGDPRAPKLRATVRPEPNKLEPFRLN
jgi:hypothetical protein